MSLLNIVRLTQNFACPNGLAIVAFFVLSGFGSFFALSPQLSLHNAQLTAEASEIDPKSKQNLQSKREAFWQEEVQAAESKVKTNPRDAIAQLKLGIAYSRLYAVPKAYAAFTEAIRLNPQLQRAYVYRGASRGGAAIFLKQSGMGSTKEISKWQQEALQDFDKALKLNPTNIFALNERAGLHASFDRKEEAISDLNSVLEIDPVNRQALIVRSSLYSEQKKFKEAMRDIETAIYYHSLEPNLRGVEGLLFQLMSENEMALEAYNEGIDKPHGLRNLLQERAKLLRKLGRTEEANKDRIRANQVD